MINTKETNKKLNLIGNYKAFRKINRHDYKAEYTKLFPTKMSSSSFLYLYTLFILDKKAEPLYGLQILSEIQKSISPNVWKPSHGTHYPILKTLVKNGYIENVKVISDKRYYAITELGKKELELRLSEFKPMLIEATIFFSHMLTEMYNDVIDNFVATDTIKVDERQELNSNSILDEYRQIVEMLTTINNEVKELGTKIDNQCVEIRVIKSAKN